MALTDVVGCALLLAWVGVWTWWWLAKRARLWSLVAWYVQAADEERYAEARDLLRLAVVAGWTSAEFSAAVLQYRRANP